ncbi:hypothetical protein M2352_003164 [Azospirillum fermentarium]|uniref:hypothetical protein n=1 Tax=Azospirillum fermentarium TaxID=1233114 RepID=UPI002227C52F|nr:hypothetical protein [Azospirillum fermentarium]MCW2247530.1 hypothetical protein [Azospirillum fermentarium]
MADTGTATAPRAAAGAGDGQPGDGLRAVASAAAQGWRTVAATVLLCVLAALAGLWSVEPHYTAVLVTGPTARTGVAGMGTRVPAAGGQAFGLAEPGAAEETLSDFTRFLHLLTSAPVAQALMEDPGVLPRLFPSRWDAAAAAWRPPGGAAALMRRALLTLSGREEPVKPDAGMVAAWLRTALMIEPVGTTPMRRLRLRHPDRAFAMALLTRVMDLSDGHLRREAERRSAAQTAYLREVVSGAPGRDDTRQVFSQMLADQERIQVMLRAGLPFAADPIEPASAPPQPDWPDPVIVLPGALAAGVPLGIVLAAARAAWRRRRDG